MKLLKRGGRLVKHAGRLVKAAAAAVASCICCGASCEYFCDGGTPDRCIDVVLPVSVSTNCCYFHTHAGTRIFMKVNAFPAVIAERVCPKWLNLFTTPIQNGCIFGVILYHPDYPYAPGGVYNATPPRSDEGFFDPADFDIELFEDDACTTPYTGGTANPYYLVGIQIEADFASTPDRYIRVKLFFNNDSGTQEFPYSVVACYLAGSPPVSGDGDLLNHPSWVEDASGCCVRKTFDLSGCASTVTFDDSYTDYVWNPETEEYEEVYVEVLNTYCLMPIRAAGEASICIVTAEEL